MSIAIGLTAAFGAAAGFTIAGVSKMFDGFSIWGPSKEELPNWPTTLLLGTLIGGGLGGGSAWYFDEDSADLNNISLQQSEAITECHKKAPENFKVESGLNTDGSVICNYIKP